MEIVLIVLTYLYSKKHFLDYRYLHILILMKTCLVILIYFVYQNIYEQYNGLIPLYSDQQTYLNLAFTGSSGIPIWKTLFTTSLHSANYGVFLGYFKDISFSVQSFAIMLNNFSFLFLIIYTLKILKFLNIKKKYSIISAYFLILSPIFIFFTTLVLRDIIISTFFVILIYYFLRKKYLKLIQVIVMLMLLKKHLIVLTVYSFVLLQKKNIKLSHGIFITVGLLITLSVLNINNVKDFLIDLPDFIVNLPIDFLGLTFIFADTTQYFNEQRSLLLMRFMVVDTYLPQIILIYILIYYRKIIKISNITFIYLIVSIPYLYLYYKFGGMTFRAGIMPFTALIYIQLIYYYCQIKDQKKSLK